MGKRIVIDKSENLLRLYENGKLLKTYPVATGKDPSLTPEGTFSIVNKIPQPAWTNPETGNTIPGGSPRNPLGSRWLGLSVGGGSTYGIHGTNQPASIGGYLTQGCVRMHNWAVEELSRLVPVGTPVVIQK